MRRPALRWFGGKWRLAPWIIEHLPEHRIYVEPFGGAASVLLRKPRSHTEIYNDLNDCVYTFFKVAQNQGPTLQSLLEQTPFARREFELAHAYHPDPVERSRRLVIRSFMGFAAESAANMKSKTGFRSNSIRSGTTPAHDWVNYPPNIEALQKRLKGVVIENRDAFVCMEEHDSIETLHYVDPPYPKTVRRGGRYDYEFESEKEHQELVDFLGTLKGKVIVSGYAHPIYEALGWRRVSREARADGAKKTVEVLWMNYEQD